MSIANRLALAAAALALAAALPAQDPGIALEPFASGLTNPIDVTHAGDGSGRLFVNEQAGKVRILDATGAIVGTYLDISGRISAGGERGLLGLAFAPDYATSGRFYVYYTNPMGSSVVSRFTTATPASNDASAAVEEVLLTFAQPYTNHNGGDLAFGPDGLLYVASGDGGSANDPQALSQDLSSLLGKILRLDVSGATGYSIPPGNYPGAAPEVFAAGLRNPWRMSFDGDALYIGDVGQNAREEIDILRTTDLGANFGWVCYEGSRDNTGVPSAARSNCQPYASYVAPYYEYPHSVGRSVTGGAVYRGSDYPQLRGVYIAADFVFGTGFAIRGTGANQEVYTTPGFGNQLAGFGESQDGELFAVSYSGTVSRVVSTVPVPATLVSVSAQRDGACEVTARWEAATERNVAYYEVQVGAVGASGITWAAFAKTPATGKGEYAATVAPPPGATYLRLRTVDEDGGSELSGAVVIEGRCGASARVWPNPVRLGGRATLVAEAAGGPVRLSDAAGRLLWTGEVGVDREVALPTAGLSAGTYVLTVGGERWPLIVVE